LKKTLHAHCFLNCFREIRDASVEEIIRLLTVCIFVSVFSCNYISISFKAHKINVPEELRQKPQATGPGCPVEGCLKAASVTCDNRFCEYDILVYLYLLKFCLKPDRVTNNFYAYLCGVIK
jgi:hypothetical protein